MNRNSRLKVYQGMIQFLLESTNYTFETIADFTSYSVKEIRSIYLNQKLPEKLLSEKQLIKLYRIILDIHTSKTNVQKLFE
ncbi:hypothetical protein GH742_03320 [Legionella sp. MW5194]|uniref:hypothetical protein n=1 Tax=Legionella sp. MW5194 TaxID=2662448 RepID=UPI00193E8395|nr:hypothetical protein [Legionella sp. MW5194]QRN02972.1 hypothetical protein GH742_03320 [Legionella sp. MW5194]